MSSLKKISHEQLSERLRNGVVRFYFHKVGGELRIASGTKDLTRIPTSGQPKGGQAPPSVSKEVWID
jgi:hypothetical protein